MTQMNEKKPVGPATSTYPSQNPAERTNKLASQGLKEELENMSTPKGKKFPKMDTV